MSLRRPAESREASRGLTLGAVAVVLAVAFLALLIAQDAIGAQARALIVDCGLVIAGGCAAVSCGGAARACSGRLRLAWALLCVTATLWCAGNLVWFLYQAVSDRKSVV
jgi:hypothetical protein